MEWLMGKARGVSRGLMNATPTPSSPSEPNMPPLAGVLPSTGHSNSPSPDAVVSEMRELKNSLSNRRSPPINSGNFSPSLKVDFISSANSPTGALGSRLSPETEVQPLAFMKPCYLKQQLPLTNSSRLTTDFPSLVQPLPTLEVNEWIAAHTIGLFENLSTIFDAIYELCVCSSLRSCNGHDYEEQLVPSPSNGMTEYPPHENFLVSGPKKSANRGISKKSFSARQAINIALSECNDIIQSSRVFPIKHGQPFPSDLPGEATKICRKLLVCLSHIYISHFHHLEQLELVAHMNTLAKHFFAFTKHFSLIADCELGHLNGFHEAILSTPAPTVNYIGSRQTSVEASSSVGIETEIKPTSVSG